MTTKEIVVVVTSKALLLLFGGFLTTREESLNHLKDTLMLWLKVIDKRSVK